jgi:histidinol dehydrogenase
MYVEDYPMNTNIRSVQDHRLDREAGAIIYPVISRRSRGLSVGINLFPDKKLCSFDCPYCEVSPLQTDLRFSLKAMEQGLRDLAEQLAARGEIHTVRDLSFSGNGEPTLHPEFQSALKLAFRLRKELFPGSQLVLITNGSRLLNPTMAAFLAQAARGEIPYIDERFLALHIWLKFDAGTEGWYKKINRSAIPFGALNEAIDDFARRAPFTIQTMICKIQGQTPPPEEVSAWEARVRQLAERSVECSKSGGPVGPQAVQLYGKARPAPEDPKTEPVDESYLVERRDSLLKALAPYSLPVEVFV